MFIRFRSRSVFVCVWGTVRSSFPPRSPLRAQKGRMALPLNQLPRTSSRDSRTAQNGLRPRLPPGRGRGPSLPHLTFLVLGVRGPPSAGAVAPRLPKARARGAGPRPRSAAGVRPASDSGGIVPKLFVHRHDGPRPCVCPGGVPGPSPYPGPRPSARPRFSPCAGPRLCPAVSRGGVLGPGGGAGLGPALSAGPGTRDSPTSVVPWLCSVSPPLSDPRATIHKFPRQVAKPGGGAGRGGTGAHLRARALTLLRARRAFT